MRNFFLFRWVRVFPRWSILKNAPVKLIFSTAAATFSIIPVLSTVSSPIPVSPIPPILTNIQLQLDASVSILDQLLLEYELQIGTLAHLEQSHDAILKLLREAPYNTELADQMVRLRADWQDCNARCIVLQFCLDVAATSLEKSLDVAVLAGPHFAAKPVLEELAMCDRAAGYSNILHSNITQLKQKNKSIVESWHLQATQDICQSVTEVEPEQ